MCEGRLNVTNPCDTEYICMVCCKQPFPFGHLGTVVTPLTFKTATGSGYTGPLAITDLDLAAMGLHILDKRNTFGQC